MDLISDNRMSQESNIYGGNLLAAFLNLNVTGLVKRVIDVKKMEFYCWFSYQFAE